MLNPFPQLLMFGFFVPTLIRTTVAAVFVYLALTHFKTKKDVAHSLPFKSNEVAVWAVGIAILIELGIAGTLFFGAYTQIAALLAALGSIKALALKRRFPALYPLAGLAYALLAVMAISIIFTGAGAFAFDLPL